MVITALQRKTECAGGVCVLARIGLCAVIGLPSHLIHLLCVAVVRLSSFSVCVGVCVLGNPCTDELILMGLPRVIMGVM